MYRAINYKILHNGGIVTMAKSFAVNILFLAVLLLPASVHAGAENPVVVIVNVENSIDAVTPDYLLKLYDNSLLKWPNGVPVKLYDLSVEDPVREVFSEVIFGKPSNRVAEQWAHMKITNQAKNPPFVMKSQSLIIDRVAREKGAVGYVLLGSVIHNASVRIVTTLR